MLVLALMDMGNALWQTSTIRWLNSNLHEPKKHLKLHPFALSLSHHASSPKPTERSSKTKSNQLINWDLPQTNYSPSSMLFFFSGFLSQQFPSLKLTAKAPENGGPLQKIRFLYWKPPFSGGGVALSFREVITLDSSLPPRMHGTRMLACVTCCATGSTWEQNDDAKSKSWRIQSAG